MIFLKSGLMDITVLVNFRLVKISKTVLKRNIENRLFIWYNALRQKLRVVRKDNKNPGSCSEGTEKHAFFSLIFREKEKSIRVFNNSGGFFTLIEL